MSDNEIANRIDPFEASRESLLVVVFPKSNSKYFPLAVNIAEGASRYAVARISGTETHFACFAASSSDAGRAIALLDYVNGWKGTQIFAQGKLLQDTHHIREVLDCYLESLSCRDYRAHCHTVIDDPFDDEPEQAGLSLSIQIVDRPTLKQEVEVDRYTFPCSLLKHRFRFQKDHPASAQDQIQAAAVRHGCALCPNFDPDAWEKIGTRTVLKEIE